MRQPDYLLRYLLKTALPAADVQFPFLISFYAESMDVGDSIYPYAKHI